MPSLNITPSRTRKPTITAVVISTPDSHTAMKPPAVVTVTLHEMMIAVVSSERVPR
jgi:hypothetical protein